MKKLSWFPLVVTSVLTTVALLIAPASYIGTATAQHTEFTIYDNGLIYDNHTMQQLGHIVDSLNLRFKSCEPRDYHSIAQGYATVVILEKDLDNARQAIQNGMALEAFLQKFPDAKHRRQWITKHRYRDYQDDKVIEYRLLPLRNGDRIGIRIPDRQSNDKESGWVFLEEGDGIVAAYLEAVHARAIPTQYTALIQYADCMIDTTAQIYLTDGNSRTIPELPQDSKVKAYLELADDFEGRPQLPDINWDSSGAESLHNKYIRESERWEKARLAALDQKMKTDVRYRLLLLEATSEAIEGKRGNPALEFYAGRYLSPAKALALMRLRRPVGRCSQDQAPRLHAQRICRLAAETTQWDIFLRAHLDIMNDNFSRVSDGNYAWARRGTYLKELEELDIEVIDLLLGTALRAADVNHNHYFGDVGRLGRALSETSEKDHLEHRLLSAIQDTGLDLYNRLIMAYLFEGYNYHVQNDTRKKENGMRFENAIASLPDEIRKNFESILTK